MQQRSEPHDSLDDFPTPCWATRAVIRYIAQYSSRRLGVMTCREPCANRGHMVRPLKEAFGAVLASDVHDYGAGFKVQDYLFGPPSMLDRTDWTFLNPPFRLAKEFIERALDLSDEGVAVIARTAFLEGESRYRDLYARPETRPDHVLQFAERVVMLKGRLVRSGDLDPTEDNPDKKAGTATAYCALVYFKRRTGPTLFDWIPPCRRELEVAGDYPADPRGLADLTLKARP
jgi:hypothetical protein